MNPELERRLRRFGATVDAAAAAKDAQRSAAGREGTPVADLDNVVAIGARPRRTVHTLAVAAAVVTIAVAGGIAIALNRSGPSTSTAEATNRTRRPRATASRTAVVVRSRIPARIIC